MLICLYLKEDPLGIWLWLNKNNNGYIHVCSFEAVVDKIPGIDIFALYIYLSI